jgi:hypothetical protein
VDELAALVAKERPGLPLLRVSAETGAGFAAFEEFLAQRGNFGQRILELDYDVYAEGEAELGWLNSSLRIRGQQGFSLDPFLLDVIGRLRVALSQAGAEPAHLKVIGMADGSYGVANLVSSGTPAELSIASNATVREADLIVNARVAIDPESLVAHVRQAIEQASASRGATAEFRQTQSFRPGRPVPTHRFADAV